MFLLAQVFLLLGTMYHHLLWKYLRPQEILAGTCHHLIPMHNHSLICLHRNHHYIQTCVSKFLCSHTLNLCLFSHYSDSPYDTRILFRSLYVLTRPGRSFYGTQTCKTPSYLWCLKLILILSSHVYLGLPRDRFH